MYFLTDEYSQNCYKKSNFQNKTNVLFEMNTVKTPKEQYYARVWIQATHCVQWHEISANAPPQYIRGNITQWVGFHGRVSLSPWELWMSKCAQICSSLAPINMQGRKAQSNISASPLSLLKNTNDNNMLQVKTHREELQGRKTCRAM